MKTKLCFIVVVITVITATSLQQAIAQWATNGSNIYNTNTGNVGIGTSSPQRNLSVSRGMNIDQNNANSGTLTPGFTFGSNSGEGIASKRTTGGNQSGLDFYTLSLPRMSITHGGFV